MTADSRQPTAGSRVVGIDLAGSPKRDTGFCVFDGKRAQVSTLYSDQEILEQTLAARPALITMDAPLGLPRGRRLGKRPNTILGSRKIHFRKCDFQLRGLGLRFFPITLGPMRMLTWRGMDLARRLRRKGLKVLETYPGASQDLWGIPRNKNMPGLLRGLRGLGLKGLKKSHTKDELDGATCALTAWLHLRGKARLLGIAKESQILVPRVGLAK